MLLAQNKDLVRIPDSFFSYMHVLRLLDLSYTGIENLPNSISTLENLAALYLKHCERLWYVPSVAKLHELRELDLRHTSIQHVPEGMEMLINLRYLNLYVQDLEFPIGILPKLSCLEYFRLWRGSKTLKVKGEELVGLRKIEKIEIQLYSLSSLNSFVGSLNGRVLRKYFLQLGEEDLHRPGDFRKVVRVVDYGIGEEGVEDSLLLPIDVEYLSIERSHNFKSLSYVSLQKKGKDCPRMVSSSHTTPQPIPLCAFSRLTFLKIQGCPDLKNLFMPGLLLQLQNLEEVLIYDCPQMEQILALEVKDRNVGMGEASSSNHFAMKNEDVAMTFTLPNLRNLCLSELPELKSICRWLVYCPSLIYMTVNGCPNLKRLPLGLPMVDGELFPLPNLEQIYVQDEKWWESLEWDQPGSKIALQPFCKFLHC
uniref:LRR-RLK n=1 Tax=Vernicia fordii TaxID=73154 RepID=A0A127AUR2_VERFO|nr:LRR-RLK [Vernicia fordii]